MIENAKHADADGAMSEVGIAGATNKDHHESNQRQ